MLLTCPAPLARCLLALPPSRRACALLARTRPRCNHPSLGVPSPPALQNTCTHMHTLFSSPPPLPYNHTTDIQYTDIHGEVCPANWTPGSKTMIADPVKSQAYFNSA